MLYVELIFRIRARGRFGCADGIIILRTVANIKFTVKALNTNEDARKGG